MSFFGKGPAAPEAEPPAKAEPGGAARDAVADAARKRKLWATLLVLDVVLLLIFGTAIAGILYMRTSVPELAEVPGRAKGGKAGSIGPKSAPPPDSELPKPGDSAPEGASAAKKEPAAPPAHEEKGPKGPAGSPAMHASALPKHAAAEPMAAAPKSEKPAQKPEAQPPAAAPGARPRARPVEFTIKAPTAKEVFLRGPFLVRSGGRQPMAKDSDGVWRLSISLLPGEYKYSFIIDGKRTPNEARLVE